ncbi:hyphally regulated cell wall protein [Scheffersomyces xylosifermentans]|uniref:hyphally regulated cell wall protein n=1 Tax=Scheffersomyces xylosifermentans TaxID=1304137 RepID=UPI00315C7B1D
MLLRNLLAAPLLLLGAVRAVTITENTVDRGLLSVGLNGVTVEDGVYWSIIDNFVTAFLGSVDVGTGSGLYISSSSSLLALTVTLLPALGDFKNDGIVSFDALKSLTPPIYNIVGISFTNNGEMYLGGDGSVGIPVFTLTSPVWDNNGLLVFYQNHRSTSVVSLGTPLSTINNNGQICLYNSLYTQLTNIVGHGCITANQDSSIFLSNTLLNVDPNQIFVLRDSQSSLRATAISVPKTFVVSGFGNGNKIGLDIPLINLPPLLDAWDYDGTSGILTLRGAGLLSQKFKIGTGYDKNLFSIVTDDDVGLLSVLFGAVTYSGPVPSPALPAQCTECKTLPEIPEANPTTTITSTWTGTFTTTITETDTQGGTDTVIIEVPTSYGPNPTTTITSTWTGTVTTTVTETDTPGGTDTVIVEVPSSYGPNPTTTITSTWTGPIKLRSKPNYYHHFYSDWYLHHYCY